MFERCPQTALPSEKDIKKDIANGIFLSDLISQIKPGHCRNPEEITKINVRFIHKGKFPF